MLLSKILEYNGKSILYSTHSRFRENAMSMQTIAEIFERYKIPYNLQLHMVRTAAIGKLLCDHWSGPKIDSQVIIKTLLLHDTGNIVKIDFDKTQNMLSPREPNGVDHRKFQNEMIKKYGKDDHEVSMKIAEEIGVSERIISLIGQKVFVKNLLTANSDDYELKITAYADQRIGPDGVLTLDARFEEAKKRYNGKTGASMNHPDVELFIECAHQIESQILQFTDLDSADINDETIKPMIDSLFAYKI